MAILAKHLTEVTAPSLTSNGQTSTNSNLLYIGSHDGTAWKTIVRAGDPRILTVSAAALGYALSQIAAPYNERLIKAHQENLILRESFARDKFQEAKRQLEAVRLANERESIKLKIEFNRLLISASKLLANGHSEVRRNQIIMVPQQDSAAALAHDDLEHSLLILGTEDLTMKLAALLESKRIDDKGLDQFLTRLSKLQAQSTEIKARSESLSEALSAFKASYQKALAAIAAPVNTEAFALPKVSMAGLPQTTESELKQSTAPRLTPSHIRIVILGIFSGLVASGLWLFCAFALEQLQQKPSQSQA
ncbi:hypothetical protein E3A20_21110 [Planctomyces bekefii]|uniref:Uncharacterized protein n=1 Tax=Planctomyces bekefii TaxID=1653850 RepID=A0A5C6M6U1_9PLAN|nr:hypothetical protein E3A20_21110 [Planctomyces bekefii]